MSDLEVLEARFLHSFADAALSEQLDSECEAITAFVEPLVADAEWARQALVFGKRPSPKQWSALEQIIRLRRIAPACRFNAPTPSPHEASYADVWPEFQSHLQVLQSSVARLDRVVNPDAAERLPVGTGFLVGDGLLLTTMRVVEGLSRGPMEIERGQAVAEFHAYSGVSGTDRCDILSVVDFDPQSGLAVLKIDAGTLDASVHRLRLSLEPPQPEFGRAIVVVGCPLGFVVEQEPFARVVFPGHEFGIKRAAIGVNLDEDSLCFAHDCSTLRGNAGSPVFDLVSGAVVGVHVRGESLARNEAVRGDVANELVQWAKGREIPEEAPHVHVPNDATVDTELKDYIEDLQRRDPELILELDELEIFDGTLIDQVPQRPGIAKSIVMTTGRPVLDIVDGQTLIEPEKILSETWTRRLENAASILSDNVPAVGRIELANHPRGIEWIGTGWLLHSNVVVTNRHVVDLFGREAGGEFIFRPGLEPGPMEARIDFLEEFDRECSHEFPLYKILHIEPDGGPDIAFLRVEPIRGGALPPPVRLSESAAEEGDPIAVIGYPARDPYYPDPEEMDRIFDYRYDKKRLAPGLVSGVGPTRVFHDCTTLGGNSGGEVVSLATGRAVALHFAGTAFKRNHAIPANVVGDRLDDVISGRVRRARPKPPPKKPDIEEPASPSPAESPNANVKPVENGITTQLGEDGCLEATIPIHVRIQLGKPKPGE